MASICAARECEWNMMVDMTLRNRWGGSNTIILNA